jgi:Tfp pilus assembly protein PilN
VLIEINLAPGEAIPRSRSERNRTLQLPGMPAFNGERKTYLGYAGVVLLAGWTVLGYRQMGAREAALNGVIEEQLADSIRYASTFELVSTLQARQDTVVRKLGTIQGVDSRRFVWPRLMDEISLALPPYTWLAQITSVEAADSAAVQAFTVQGSAGSTQAMTRFMKNLEESAFVEGVTLITSEQETIEGRTIQRFSLEASYSESNSPNRESTGPVESLASAARPPALVE